MKLKADTLKVKGESFFGITLPYSMNFTFGAIVTYSYGIGECTILKFRDVFLEHKPSLGFGEIITQP